MTSEITNNVIFRRHKWDTKTNYPYCSLHGAMNKVSKFGLWRCLCCHVGYDEQTGQILSNSKEGFIK